MAREVPQSLGHANEIRRRVTDNLHTKDQFSPKDILSLLKADLLVQEALLFTQKTSRTEIRIQDLTTTLDAWGKNQRDYALYYALDQHNTALRSGDRAEATIYDRATRSLTYKMPLFRYNTLNPYQFMDDTVGIPDDLRKFNQLGFLGGYCVRQNAQIYWHYMNPTPPPEEVTAQYNSIYHTQYQYSGLHRLLTLQELSRKPRWEISDIEQKLLAEKDETDLIIKSDFVIGDPKQVLSRLAAVKAEIFSSMLQEGTLNRPQALLYAIDRIISFTGFESLHLSRLEARAIERLINDPLFPDIQGDALKSAYLGSFEQAYRGIDRMTAKLQEVTDQYARMFTEEQIAGSQAYIAALLVNRAVFLHKTSLSSKTLKDLVQDFQEEQNRACILAKEHVAQGFIPSLF